MARILLVDDEADILSTMSELLTIEGHDVVTATSAEEARQRLREGLPDLVLLDVMLPGETGIEFCVTLRNTPETSTLPVIFLSARSGINEVIDGLDAGGDDYLTKPFDVEELRARIRAQLRRLAYFRQDSDSPSDQINPQIIGSLVLDEASYRVSTDTRESVQLTATEFRLLSQLASSPERAHPIDELLDSVWEYPKGTGDPDLVRAHIRNLRAKIEDDPKNPTYVKTIHGVGYMLDNTQ